MARFKLVISEPETGKSKSVEVEGVNAVPFIGRRLGETLDGSVIGLRGRLLLITGASDKDGFPLRSNVRGGAKKTVLLTGGPGFNPRRRGERRRKLIRGNMITEDVLQVNLKVLPEEKAPAGEAGGKPER
ncbi:MAG: 30S ribosomal protein S6e [Candidatus Bathyarchaeia archaeon]